jgi:hypothetical protein
MRFKAMLLIRVQLSDRIRIGEEKKIRTAVYHISTRYLTYRYLTPKESFAAALINCITFYQFLIGLVLVPNPG